MSDEKPGIETTDRSESPQDDRREWVTPEINELPVTASAGATGNAAVDSGVYS